MKRKKHLEFYYGCMTRGRMPYNGLCNNGLDKRRIKMFRPIENIYTTEYWASDDTETLWDKFYSFGPTRQTIVLFLAAMNDEL